MDNIDKNDIFKEIEMIQSCISRMASNSFAMKGWHIGIISALIVFFFSKDTCNFDREQNFTKILHEKTTADRLI